MEAENPLAFAFGSLDSDINVTVRMRPPLAGIITPCGENFRPPGAPAVNNFRPSPSRLGLMRPRFY